MSKFFSVLLMLIPLAAFSQKWDLGPAIGLASYQGDLTEKSGFSFKNANPVLGLSAGHNTLNHLTLRGNFFIGKLSGDDTKEKTAWRKLRGFSFASPLIEFSGYAEWHILGKSKNEQVRKWSPFVFTGIGTAITMPKTMFNDGGEGNEVVSKAIIDSDRNADKSHMNLFIPMGMGVQYKLSEKFNLGFYGAFQKTFTDYIDGVSLAGNADKNDNYFSIMARIGYRMYTVKDMDKDGIADALDQCPMHAGSVQNHGCPDTDGDGVLDKVDKCPGLAGNGTADGCPDTDGDGLIDTEDQCPKLKGAAMTHGCPDFDGDGIVDDLDLCPDAKGSALLSGCPDTDGDGISDIKDNCPNERGPKDNFGCPMADSDGDGILDKDDTCPTVKGSKMLSGCPDGDNDGIADKDDNCPTVAGTVANKGCPTIAAEDKAKLDYAIRNVQFATSKADILAKSFTVLDEVAGVMAKYPTINLAIAGHTDNVGGAEANQKLSENRAKACMDYLVKKGINSARMSYIGYGETMPVADNKTAEGRLQNRRVEFNVVQ